MKIAVIGYGRQGKSAAEYWHKLNHNVTICDQNTSVIAPNWAKKQLGAKYLNNLKSFDLIVRSPMVHPSTLAKAGGNDILKKVTTTTNEFMQVCPSKNIIGVTGTKGKGTTSTLITKMLEAAGKTVHLGGNIGIDPLQLLKNNIKKDDWVVLELANFQLIDLKHSPHIAVCLMAVPEHQDWHINLEEYYLSKSNLFAHQKAKDIAVYNNNYESTKFIVNVSSGQKIRFDVPNIGHKPKITEAAYVMDNTIYFDQEKVCTINKVALKGRHNLENICAAISAVWDIINDKQIIIEVIKQPLNLGHRLEHVKTIADIAYYNDSLSTTPETTIAAIKSFKEPKILILGGSDKGIDLEPIAIECKQNNVKYCILTGKMANHIAEKFIKYGMSNYSIVQSGMNDIVKNANNKAKTGDVVLLSPGCASFGDFKDYEDRGKQFKNAVLNL